MSPNPNDIKKILVVDDEEPLCRTLKDNLEITGNYKVNYETKGKNALAVVHKFKPDIIILDIIMPGKDGVNVAYQLQKDEKAKDIPVIFYSAIASKDEVGDTFELTKEFTLLTKPATIDQIIGAIEKKLADTT